MPVSGLNTIALPRSKFYKIFENSIVHNIDSTELLKCVDPGDIVRFLPVSCRSLEN